MHRKAELASGVGRGCKRRAPCPSQESHYPPPDRNIWAQHPRAENMSLLSLLLNVLWILTGGIWMALARMTDAWEMPS